MRHTLLLIISLLVASCASSPSVSLSSGPLVDWTTEQGMQRFNESAYKVDFFKLANNYQAQPNGIVCGPTTGAIVLNALRLSKKDQRLPFIDFNKKLKKNLPQSFDPRVKMYTPRNFVGPQTKNIKTKEQIFGEPIAGKKDFGLQVRQLHKMFKAHGAQSTLRVVSDDFKIEDMRKEMLNNLKRVDDYVIINYKRKDLGQKGGGHISPIGAYHKASDSFLILDVTASKHQWIWAPAVNIFKAMQTYDTVENRGYLLIKE